MFEDLFKKPLKINLPYHRGHNHIYIHITIQKKK